MSNTIERLSGGLVLSGWAGITVTRILLTDSWYLATGGSISAPPSTCAMTSWLTWFDMRVTICVLMNAVIGTP